MARRAMENIQFYRGLRSFEQMNRAFASNEGMRTGFAAIESRQMIRSINSSVGAARRAKPPERARQYSCLNIGFCARRPHRRPGFSGNRLDRNFLLARLYLALYTGGVVPSHVIIDQRLEFFGDAIAFQRDGLFAVDVYGRHGPFARARQRYADGGQLGLSRSIDHAAHDSDVHVFDARKFVFPHRHLIAQISLDLVGQLLEKRAGGAPATRAGGHHRCE